MRVLLAVGLLVFGLNNFAKASDSSDGCGAGWYITSDTSLLATSVRGTTNGILPPTFSMTSGTSNCAQHSIVLEEKRALHFLTANLDQVKSDIARGQGVYLDAFALTLGCGESSIAFGSLLRNHYLEIFPATADTKTSLSTVHQIVHSNAQTLGCMDEHS